jgi:malonyl-CoA O-methyltransferase
VICDSRKQVRASFNKGAAFYNKHAEVQQRVAEQFFLRTKSAHAVTGSVLDVGCGTGFLTEQIHGQYPNASLIALDAAPQMLASLPVFPAIEKICADFDTIPLASESCGAVFSSTALQWSQDAEKTLTEWLRVLKRGGELCFSTFLAGTLCEWDRCWRSVGESRRVNRLLTDDEMKSVELPLGCEWTSVQTQTLTDFHLTTASALASVRAIGAGKRLRLAGKNGLMGQKRWNSFLSAYETMRTSQGLPLSYEVFYGVIKKK